MSAQPSIPLPRHRLSVADYHRMAEAGILHEDERVELIDGDIIDMAPIGPEHAFSVNYLARIFDRCVGDRAIVSLQNPVQLDAHSEPQPDLALLKFREDFYREALPAAEDVLLIVEVSASSLRYDRDIKLPLYARFGIPEVWILDLAGRQLEIHRHPVGQHYRETLRPSDTETVAPVALPDCGVKLAALL